MANTGLFNAEGKALSIADFMAMLPTEKEAEQYAIIIGKLKFNTEEIVKAINEEGDGHCFQWKLDIESCE